MSKNTSHPLPVRDNSKKESRFWQKIFPFLKKEDLTDLRENLREALAQENEITKTFSPEEGALLNNILNLNNARVDDIMIPRSEIEALSIHATLGEALHLFENSGYSRLPVYTDSLDNPNGMIHIRDVLSYLTRCGLDHKNTKNLNLSNIDLTKSLESLNIVRNLLFVPQSMLAIKLLQRMQVTHLQMALVIDEHGGIDGLVSMEDLMELIVGDIEDEHDDEAPMISEEGEHSWLIDGKAELSDIQKILGPSFQIDDSSEDVDTIGGLIVTMLDRIPLRGETIDLCPGFRARILEADKRRMKKVRIRYIPNLLQETLSKEA